MEKVSTLDPRLFAACVSAISYSLRVKTDGRIPCAVFDKVILPHYFPEANEAQVSAYSLTIRRHPASFARIYGDELFIDGKKMPPANGPTPATFDVPDELTNGHNATLAQNGHAEPKEKAAPPALTPEQRALAALLMVDETSNVELGTKKAKQIIATVSPSIDSGATLRRFSDRLGYLKIHDSKITFTMGGRRLARPWYQAHQEELVAALNDHQPKVKVVPPKPAAQQPAVVAPQPPPVYKPPAVVQPAPELPPIIHEPVPTPSSAALPVHSGKETGELNRRICEDLALAESEKTDKLNDSESTACIIRYTGDRKAAQKMRSRLGQAELLKSHRPDAKDGSARWFDTYTGPFTNIRHYTKDVDLLQRIKPLTVMEARAIVGKTVGKEEPATPHNESTVIEQARPLPDPTPLPRSEPPPAPRDETDTPVQPIESPSIRIEALTARIIEEHRLLIHLKNGKALSNAESLTIFKRYIPVPQASPARVRLIERGILVKVGNDFALSDCKLISTPGKAISLERLRSVAMLTPEEGLRIIHSLPLEAAKVPVVIAAKETIPSTPVTAIEPPASDASTKPEPPAPAPPPAMEEPAVVAEVPKVNHGALIMRLVVAAEHAQSNIDTTQRKLAELATTREAILATLAEAERAIADQQTALASHTNDQQSARDAIAALTIC